MEVLNELLSDTADILPTVRDAVEALETAETVETITDMLLNLDNAENALEEALHEVSRMRKLALKTVRASGKVSQ